MNTPLVIKKLRPLLGMTPVLDSASLRATEKAHVLATVVQTDAGRFVVAGEVVKLCPRVTVAALVSAARTVHEAPLPSRLTARGFDEGWRANLMAAALLLDADGEPASSPQGDGHRAALLIEARELLCWIFFLLPGESVRGDLGVDAAALCEDEALVAGLRVLCERAREPPLRASLSQVGVGRGPLDRLAAIRDALTGGAPVAPRAGDEDRPRRAWLLRALLYHNLSEQSRIARSALPPDEARALHLSALLSPKIPSEPPPVHAAIGVRQPSGAVVWLTPGDGAALEAAAPDPAAPPSSPPVRRPRSARTPRPST